MPRTLTPEKIERIKTLWELNVPRADIAKEVGCCPETVDRYKTGGLDNYHKGGRISKTVLIKPESEIKKAEEVVELPYLVVSKELVVTGISTAIKYTVRSNDNVIIVEGTDVSGIIKVDDLPSMAKEFMAVYKAACDLKK